VVIRLKELQEDYDRAEDYLTYLQTNQYVPQANREVKRKQSQQLGFYYEYKYTFFKGPASRDMILEAENDLALHQAELDMAQHDHDLLKDGPDAEQLPVLEARLNAARANVAAAEAAMELYELRAPFSGELLSIDLAVGETALPMMPVAFVADTTRWIVKTKDLAEIDVANVSLGDSATVKLDAFANEEFPGNVTEINPVGIEYLGDMTYKVTITLDESDPRFLWNMTATVTVNTAGK
jgi:multidrug resistance efflux pump